MFLNIAYITKVNLGSLNGDEGTGGNLVTIKKISNFAGEEFPYVSGQALRHYLKETLVQLGGKMTAVDEKGNPTIPDGKGGWVNLDKEFSKYRETIFRNYFDLDLFGYMFPNQERRWSPVKVAPLLSLLPYRGDYDFLTRKQRSKNEKKAGNIVQVEIDTFNFMRGNILIALEDIGVRVDEYTYQREPILTDQERCHRLNLLLEGIKNLNGGARRSRNLEDISPKFVVVTRQKSGNPFLLNLLQVDKMGNLKVELIKTALENGEYQEVKIGLTPGIFPNEEEICQAFPDLVSPQEAIDYFKPNCQG
jgi:CRISPR-associated protein Cst2